MELSSEISVRICALFPKHLNLYGEYANLLALQRRLEDMGCSVCVDAFEGEAQPSFSDYDLLYVASGTEKMQACVLKAMQPYKKELQAYAESGKMVLATGSGAELLGREWIDANGQTMEGFGLLDFSVKQSKNRILGDVIAEFLPEQLPPLIGFVNCCGRIESKEAPFCELKFGLKRGNDGVTPAEGAVKNRVFATRLIGPLLVRNPYLLEQLIFWLGEEKGITPNDPDEKSAIFEAYRRSLAGLQERQATVGEKE